MRAVNPKPQALTPNSRCRCEAPEPLACHCNTSTYLVPPPHSQGTRRSSPCNQYCDASQVDLLSPASARPVAVHPRQVRKSKGLPVLPGLVAVLTQGAGRAEPEGVFSTSRASLGGPCSRPCLRANPIELFLRTSRKPPKISRASQGPASQALESKTSQPQKPPDRPHRLDRVFREPSRTLPNAF